MNNKKIMAVMGAVVAILLAVLVIYAVSSLISDNESGLINFGGNSGILSSEGSEEASSGANGNNSNDDYDWSEPNVGGDDGFEGSVITGNNYPVSDESSSSGSNDSSASSSNSSSGGSISGGNTSSGSSSSGSSSSSSSSGSSSGGVTAGSLSYEEYIAMSGEEQQKYFESFESVEAFFEWYNAAKAKYDEENESIEIGGDGSIDLGDIIGGGNG